MALNQVRSWLVAYDITAPRRLRRVHRLLREHAVPVQYSVFAARCSPAKIGTIRAALAGLINKREDDVRFYPVPARAHLSVFGRKALPEGLRLLEGPADLTMAHLRDIAFDPGDLASGGAGDSLLGLAPVP